MTPGNLLVGHDTVTIIMLGVVAALSVAWLVGDPGRNR